MVVVVKGTLINCDPAVREIICELDAKDHFIIEELDDGHLFIETSKVASVKEYVGNVLEQNIFRSKET